MSVPETIYAHYAIYRRTERWRRCSDGALARENTRTELQACLERHAHEVEVRGIYSAVGFRPEADIAFWLVSRSPDAIQAVMVDVGRTAFGQGVDLSWAWLSVTRPAEFSPDHRPAFVQGKSPLKYLCVYPYVRTVDWYLLPADERGRMLREHGLMGREFPEIQSNTVQAFGLGDYEWILSFEAERLDRIVDMIRRLRDAEARRYTKLETPFVIGIRKPLAEALADLG